MKGNFQLKLVIFLVLSCFCLVKPTSGISQCSNGIYLKEISKTSLGLSKGAIVVSIESQGNYECILYRMTGAGNEVVKSIKGRGEQLIKFDELPAYNAYKIVTTFLSEEDLRCRKRQIGDLSTIE